MLNADKVLSSYINNLIYLYFYPKITKKEDEAILNLNIFDNGVLYNKPNLYYHFNGIPALYLNFNLSPASNSDFSQDISEISDDAHIQYIYIKELQDSANPDNPEFIENYALQYTKIKSGILNESPENEIDKKINLLDKVYNDVVNYAADKLSHNFESFFNYSYTEWPQNDSESKAFDKEIFKNTVLSMSDTVMSVVEKAFENNNFDNLQLNIENKLSSIESGTTTDIKEVAVFFKSLPQFKNHIKEYFEDSTYRPIANNWSISDAADAINKQYSMAENFLQSGNTSSNTAKTVYNTVLKNISAYHRNFAFGFQLDDFQAEINKDNSYYKLLKAQYDKYEKKLQDARKQNKMKIVLMYLEILGSYKDKLGEIKDKLKDDLDAKNKLLKNPESVVNTDAYKAISSLETFDESKRA